MEGGQPPPGRVKEFDPTLGTVVPTLGGSRQEATQGSSPVVPSVSSWGRCWRVRRGLGSRTPWDTLAHEVDQPHAWGCLGCNAPDKHSRRAAGSDRTLVR